jgi:sigma-E factor negative regulatory protein RseB
VRILVDNYTIRYAGTDSTAGRPAHVVQIFASHGVPAATFWIDKRSGVLLRREVYDADGRTVRASAFVQIKVGARHLPDHLPPMLTASVAQPLTGSDVAKLRSDGWQVPGEMALAMSLYDARRFATSTGTGLHLSYSDGLSTVSVFEEQGALDESGLDGYEPATIAGSVVQVRAGIPQQVVWSAHGVVYTVIGDAPQQTVEQIVAGLPHAEASDGVVERVGRGLSRVGSWINPFA